MLRCYKILCLHAQYEMDKFKKRIINLYVKEEIRPD